MGIIIDFFLYWLTSWKWNWDEAGSKEGDKAVFVPFEDIKGGEERSAGDKGTDYSPNDFSEFGEF